MIKLRQILAIPNMKINQSILTGRTKEINFARDDKILTIYNVHLKVERQMDRHSLVGPI